MKYLSYNCPGCSASICIEKDFIAANGKELEYIDILCPICGEYTLGSEEEFIAKVNNLEGGKSG